MFLSRNGLLSFLLLASALAAGTSLGSAAHGLMKNPGSAPCGLQGYVLDIRGASVPFAELKVLPVGPSVLTQLDGRFCLPDWDPSASGLRIEAEGFEPSLLAVGRDFTPGSSDLRLTLTVAAINDAVVVTTSAAATRQVMDIPVRTEVIQPEIIALSASRTLAEAVEFTPGIRVENNCQTCNFTQLRMLGLQGPYTQILFDGQPTVSSLAQVYGVEQIPSRMVDRIEVVKGGGSAVYGPGAVGGIVNIVSRTPTRTGGSLSSRQEWIARNPVHSMSAVGDWVSGDQQTTATLFGQVDRIRPIDLSSDGFSEVSSRQLDAFGGRFSRMFLNQHGKLTVDFNHIREDRRGGDRWQFPPHEAELAEAVGTRRTGFGASWHHSVDESFDYRLTLSQARTFRDTYYGSGRDPNAYGTSRNPLWVVDSRFNHFRKGHIFSWGGQFSSDQVEDSQPAYQRQYRETYRTAGGFVQHDWFFAPGWELIYGFRVDSHSAIDGGIVSPRAALMWTPRTDLRVRGSWARGFLPPQVFNEDLHISQAGGEAQILRNQPGLKPERSNSTMVGVEWKPVRRNQGAIIEVNWFRTRLKDLFNTALDDDPLTAAVEFTRSNFGEARVYGVEVNLGYAVSPFFEVQTGYVEQRARYSQAEPDFGSLDFFRTPNRYAVATALYRHPSRIDVFAAARYTGQMVLPHYAGYIAEDRLETTPVHWTFDAGVSKSIPVFSDSRLVLSTGVRNLRNTFQTDLDQGPLRDSGYVWGPRLPRSFYVSTAVEF